MESGPKQTAVSEEEIENSGISPKRYAAIRVCFGERITTSTFEKILRVRDAEGATKLLTSMIEAETLPLERPLPSKELGLALALHRNTIARALKNLVSRGYLSRRKGFAAQIASQHPVLPARQSTTTISYASLAEAAGVEMTNDAFGVESLRVRDVPIEDRAVVESNLELGADDEVIAYPRIRRIRIGHALLIPVVAEMAYFASNRAPPGFLDGLQRTRRVLSLSDYLRENDMEPVHSAYQVRISHLQRRFVPKWKEYSRAARRDTTEMAFLRVECTTFSTPGPIEYSVAYLHPEFFTLSSTALHLGLHLDAPTIVQMAQSAQAVSASRARRPKAPAPATRVRSLRRL